VGEDAVLGAFRSSSRRAGLVVGEGDGAEVAEVLGALVVEVAVSVDLVAVVDLEAAVVARAGEMARDRRMTKQASSRIR